MTRKRLHKRVRLKDRENKGNTGERRTGAVLPCPNIPSLLVGEGGREDEENVALQYAKHTRLPSKPASDLRAFNVRRSCFPSLLLLAPRLPSQPVASVVQ